MTQYDTFTGLNSYVMETKISTQYHLPSQKPSLEICKRATSG